MDIRKELLKEHSVRQARKIVDYVGDSPQKFKVLIELFLTESYRLSQRSAWPLTFVVEAHPGLIAPYLTRVIKTLSKPGTHDAVRRNVVRFLQFMDIPSRHQGAVADCCFTFLTDTKVPVAIRVFSMTVLANIAEKQQELKEELKIIIEDNMPYGSAAFRSRGRKILKQLAK